MSMWAAPSMVRAALDSFDTNSLSDADIEGYLDRAERFALAVMKSDTFRTASNFNNDKHGILRDFVVARATLMALGAAPLSPRTLQEAAFAADLNYDIADKCDKQLRDPSFLKYIEGL